MAELQALVGHLLVAGGRAVRMPPPGALAETAPKRAPRIREEDTFFILVTPAGDLRAPAAFFQELAQLGADTYFGSSGGITGGLREMLIAINQRVLGQPQPVDAVAVVQRGSEVYAARSGRAFAALCQAGDITFFPDDRRDPLIAHLPPLGTSPTPEIQLAHYSAAPGGLILLGGPDLIETDDDALKSALKGEGIQAALDALKPLAGQQASASVIRFVAPGVSDPAGTAPQPGSRSPRAAAPRSAKPPAEVEPAAPASSPAQPVPTPPPAVPEPVLPFALDEKETSPAGEVAPFVPDDATSVEAIETESPAVKRKPRRVPALKANFWRGPAPEPARPSPLTRMRIRVRRTVRHGLRTILSGLLAATDLITRTFDQIVPAPKEGGKQGIPTNVAVGLVVLIPVLIVVVVVGLALSKQGESDFEVYLERAKAAHQEAMTLSGEACSDPSLRPQWAEVLRLAEQAEKYRPNDAEVIVIRADARNYLDCIDKVQRRDLVLLHEFERGAQLVGPVVNGGIDLFTLDRTNGAIYHDILNERGDGLTARGDDPIVWRGQTISSASALYTVGDLLDIEWLRSGGTAHDNVLIAVDRSGLLVAYSPTFFESAQQLVTGGWLNPIAMAVFRSNLYILDVGGNQVWRYVQPAGERLYSSAPEEYFNGAELPNLTGAVDFGIDNDGAIYILFADGTVRKYRRNAQSIAEEQPFFFKENPPGALTSGSALFVDNDPASTSLWIIDPANETLYQTSWSGRYLYGYRPNNVPGAFRELSGLFADAVSRNTMYLVAGNKLYYFRRN